MSILHQFVSAVMALGLCGCAGYQLGPVKPKLYADVKTIAVETFKNDTLEPRVEVLLANAVIKQIQQDGTYRVTSEKEADVVLQCTLEGIDRRPARSVRGNVLQTKEYVLELIVRYKTIDCRTGREFEHRKVEGTTSFFVSGSNVLAADVGQDERQAIPIAAEDMAVRLVSMLSEGW